MSRRLKYLPAAVLACLALLFPTFSSADAPVKREMRSPFVATVWQLDWPGVAISVTGNATQIQRQKDRMIIILDSLKNNNFNAIAFQVRSRCDAICRYETTPGQWGSVDYRRDHPDWLLSNGSYVVINSYRLGCLVADNRRKVIFFISTDV